MKTESKKLPPLPPHSVQSEYPAGSGCDGRQWQVWLKKPLYEGGGLGIGHAGETIKEARRNARAVLEANFTWDGTEWKPKANPTPP